MYGRSFFFILTTVATIGYGDIVPSNILETRFAIVLTMIGQLLFSFFTSNLKYVFSYLEGITVIDYRQELEEDFEFFIINFSKTLGKHSLARRNFSTYKDQILTSFNFSFKHLNKSEFFKELPPNLKKKIIFACFGDYKNKFLYFFEDPDENYKAGEDFMYEIISKLSCLIARPDEKVLVRKGEVKYIYFILTGSVTIWNKHYMFLSELETGSNIGDF